MTLVYVGLGVALACVIALLVDSLLFHRSLRKDLKAAREEAEDQTNLLRLVKQVVEVTTSQYVVEVMDWGPEYTGLDGTLPRYRWAVRDAFSGIKPLLGIEAPPSTRGWLMFGNAPTPGEALVAAQQWIEKRRHPATEVSLDEQRQS